MEPRCLVMIALVACGRSGDATPASGSAVRALGSAAADASVASCVETVTLGDALVHERWPLGVTPIAGPPCIDVVRADLARYRMRALSEPAGITATAWRDREKLVAVTNAGMFHEGGAPVGLVVAEGHVRGTDNPKFGGFIAWDPVATTDPPVAMAGAQCAGFDLAALRKRYRSLVQSYRLLDCDGRALPWKDPKQYSAAGIGVDRAGRVVFLHARGAVTMAELSTALASHDLAGAIFLEGGPEASLVVRGAMGALERIGSYETGFVENDDNHEHWALPNVIGLAAR